MHSTVFSGPKQRLRVLVSCALLVGCAATPDEPTRLDPIEVEASPEAEPIEAARSAVAPRIEPKLEVRSAPDEIDIWARIRAGYALPTREHTRIDRELAWYANHQAYLDRVAERARPYLHHIVEEIDARKMPMELALLPVVESAFDPWAYSHGRAAGLWQFIPGTGRQYALEQDWWHDERRDLIESTRAALDMLEDLHETFDGDWLLALAAYNAGPGNVRKALRRSESEDFFDLPLPRETRAYVPRLLALSRLVGSPGDHGITLVSIANRPGFERVEIGGQLDIARAASLAEIDEDSLYRLNPGLNRWATHPDGPHRLLVPVGYGDPLRTSLDSLAADERIAWKRHHIRSGESLSTIASRYGLDVATLQRANRLRSTRIRAGDALLIPVAGAAEERYSGSVAQRAAARQAMVEAGSPELEKHTHVVQHGESFWTIARRYSVEMRTLARWNGMGLRDPLQIGQALVVYRTPPQSAAVMSPPEERSIMRALVYRVRSGDSLWKIAERFGLRVADILSWNNLDADRVLRPGQRLRLQVNITDH